MKKVLIISSSMRKNSNSMLLAKEFERGAIDAGNQTEFVSLSDKNIAFCKGCLACQRTQKCAIDDDANAITEKMKNADVIVFATPVYYYGMSGQLKTMLDRANSLYPSDYRFRDVYLIMTAAEDEDTTPEKTIIGLQGWLDCYEKARLAGTVFGGGVTAPDEIKNHPAVQTAYDMGKGV